MDQTEGGVETAERHERLLLAHGLHARPAAILAGRARQHADTVNIGCRGLTVNAKSVLALLGLGAHHGDTLTITVRGERARQVAEELAELVRSGLGDPLQPVPEPSAVSGDETSISTPSIPPFAPGEEVLLKG